MYGALHGYLRKAKEPDQEPGYRQPHRGDRHESHEDEEENGVDRPGFSELVDPQPPAEPQER